MNELEDELERHDELEDESKLTVRIAPEVFQKFKAAVQETLSGTAENHTSGMMIYTLWAHKPIPNHMRSIICGPNQLFKVVW